MSALTYQHDDDCTRVYSDFSPYPATFALCGRFPFLGVGNQFLTPLQYANLARLGHDLAAAPLAELVEARAAATRRKSSPAAALITRKRAEPSECADCPLLSARE